MAIEIKTLWLYLGRRDLKGVNILAILTAREQNPTRLANISTLGLPLTIASQIEKKIFDDRMLWEPWIETAATFEDLRASLKLRGYTQIPISGQPFFSKITSNLINISRVEKQKTMIRKSL